MLREAVEAEVAEAAEAAEAGPLGVEEAWPFGVEEVGRVKLKSSMPLSAAAVTASSGSPMSPASNAFDSKA